MAAIAKQIQTPTKPSGMDGIPQIQAEIARIKAAQEGDPTPVPSPAQEYQARLERAVLASMFDAKEDTSPRRLNMRQILIISAIAIVSWATVFGIGAFLVQ
ncbi:MAG: hypothetical protein E2598_05420 [Sphingobium sp.]|nr:hypothetical protein [Sphingobium sp.]